MRQIPAPHSVLGYLAVALFVALLVGVPIILVLLILV